jgi:hypothetical protein
MVGGAKVGVGIEQESVLVKGASARNYGATWTQVAAVGVDVAVGGLNTLKVSGQRAVKCSGFEVKARSLTEASKARTEKAKGDWSWTGKGGVKFEVGSECKIEGADVVFEADDKIIIKAGGVTVQIEASKVMIKGDFKSSQASQNKGSAKHS